MIIIDDPLNPATDAVGHDVDWAGMATRLEQWSPRFLGDLKPIVVRSRLYVGIDLAARDPEPVPHIVSGAHQIRTRTSQLDRVAQSRAAKQAMISRSRL